MEVNGKMNFFCGDKFCHQEHECILWRSVGVGTFSDRVSSEKLLAVSAAGPPAAFFLPEIDISGFFGHAHFGNTLY